MAQRHIPYRKLRFLGCLLVIATVSRVASAATLKFSFESLLLDGADYYNGSDLAGGFGQYGVQFNNLYTDFGNGCCWNGWAYSRTTDTTTPGHTNEYSAYAGSGAGDSEVYGVAFNGFDAGGGIIPLVTLPAGAEPSSVKVTNTTYAALSMQLGDGFAKKFGGPSGNDPDWFLLTIEGRNAAEAVVGQVPFYLADYRFANPASDYILDEWTELDLTPLAGLGVRKLAFRLSSSDEGVFGMNTPAYVAIDNLVLQVASTPGDFNLDEAVDGADLEIWKAHYGVTLGGGVTTGDADDDGDVDGLDFLLWQSNHGPLLPLPAGIPEPATVVLGMSCLLFRLRFRRSLSLA